MKAEPDPKTETLRPRALLDARRGSPNESWRAERFASVADITIDTEGYSPRQVTRTVYKALEHALDVEYLP
jgi:hypothetical protein